MVVGSNPTLSYVILGLKISFLYLKPQKGVFICLKLLPKAKKFKKQKINGEPLRTTVLGDWNEEDKFAVQTEITMEIDVLIIESKRIFMLIFVMKLFSVDKLIQFLQSILSRFDAYYPSIDLIRFLILSKCYISSKIDF